MTDEDKKKISYDKYLAGTREILEQSKKEKRPYKTTVLGREFIVRPNVFSPRYFRDTELFAENLSVKGGEEMLEIGPGTGVVSIISALKGAKKVIAIDINPDAVLNTADNIALHGVGDKVEVRQGDVYHGLKPGEKFNIIFWNTPFGFVENDRVSDLEKAVYDIRYNSTERFIKESRRHLKENGRVIIGFSTTLGRIDLLHKFVKDAHMSLHLIYEELSNEKYPVKFELFEAWPL